MIGIYAEISDGKFKKSVLEAASYANQMNSNGVVAFCVGSTNDDEIQKLSKYGVNKIVTIGSISFDSQNYTQILSKAIQKENIQTLILANTYEGKSIGPRLSIALNASLATNVISLPDMNQGFSVKRSVFSGKGFAYVKLIKDTKVIAITPNSIDLIERPTSISIENFDGAVSENKTNITSTHKAEGKIPLTEAEIVVSAGRGLKGPENWGMVEELANLLGAATACSKPVSDMGWRPHSEHVGQTGITIKPNLYIAIGISGAIQHLAGVSSSKVIVAINKDPEAPFFKAADIGIVGDAFEILPQIIAAAKLNLN
ncbi:MAG: electron transfer flavoprotein subunit alpha/FixB family protein [Bacteroidota bacterium]|nr:electron transfer flavoprotein subunit alpha/FixB family protein [Bacteroidota bacterium]